MRYKGKQSKTTIKKKQKVYFISESIEYAHRKREKVNTHKIIQQSYRILEYTVFYSGQVKCCCS